MVKRSFLLLSFAALAPAALAQGGSRGVTNPFSAPDATIHYAPDRMYHLIDLSLDFNVDYADRLLTATAVNTLTPLRDGVTQLRFNAGVDTKIESVDLNGQAATFTRDDDGILVNCPPTKIGDKDIVTVHYHLKQSEETHGGGGGWHWIEPMKSDPARTGFWTNGETADTRDWAVTWDYPNDFCTSSTKTTVPADWEVISNGDLVSDKVNPDGKTRTVYWKMSQTHATYLTSAIAGPFDIKKDNWRGKPLYYVVPKGKGKLIDYSFGHTKDMLSFQSDNIGFSFPWTKYAQDCTYDFGGGQENVTCTTLGENFLTDPRAGYYGMDWLNSHEMGHQWFGDCVTCKDWGQIWLNESFATFMEMSYMLHSRGTNYSKAEIEQNSQGYFDEAHRYKRPIVTNFYKDAGVMFDQHTYPKGGVLLMSLRDQIGWKNFYAGLKLYLERHHNSPVETNDLCVAMTDATGINLHPWFDQWIFKPGHPVIDWSWSWDDASKQATVTVKQTQDTSNGTPIYDIPAHMGFVTADGKVVRQSMHLNAASQSFQFPFDAKPSAALFDPDHEFLREIPNQPWQADELMAVACYAPDCISRRYAMDKILTSNPSDSDVNQIVAMLKRDQGMDPAILDTTRLGALKRPDLRDFWLGELKHESFDRRANAVKALGGLPADAQTSATLTSLINDRDPYAVVAAAISAVGKLDFNSSKAAIVEQARTSDNTQIRAAALGALIDNNAPEGPDLVFACIQDDQPTAIQVAALNALAQMKSDDPRTMPAVRKSLQSQNFQLMQACIGVIQARKMKEAIPDLEALEMQMPFAVRFIQPVIDDLKKAS